MVAVFECRGGVLTSGKMKLIMSLFFYFLIGICFPFEHQISVSMLAACSAASTEASSFFTSVSVMNDMDGVRTRVSFFASAENSHHFRKIREHFFLFVSLRCRHTLLLAIANVNTYRYKYRHPLFVAADGSKHVISPAYSAN